jgi:hypothetical protein
MENKKTKNSTEERKREETLRSWRWRRNARVIFNVNCALSTMACGSGVEAPRIFKVDTKWKRVFSFMPRLLYLGEWEAYSN